MFSLQSYLALAKKSLLALGMSFFTPFLCLGPCYRPSQRGPGGQLC
jgi:hypothetical protein